MCLSATFLLQPLFGPHFQHTMRHEQDPYMTQPPLPMTLGSYPCDWLLTHKSAAKKTTSYHRLPHPVTKAKCRATQPDPHPGLQPIAQPMSIPTKTWDRPFWAQCLRDVCHRVVREHRPCPNNTGSASATFGALGIGCAKRVGVGQEAADHVT